MTRIDLSGRVAILTGVGAGLGREHALLLARCGAKVVVNDLSADAAERVAAGIRSAGGQALAASGSVADVENVDEIVRGTLGPD